MEIKGLNEVKDLNEAKESDEVKDFFEFLNQEATGSPEKMHKLAYNIIQNAHKGDTSSLRLLEKVLTDSRFSKEEKLKIKDAQYRRVVLLAAERIVGDLPKGEITYGSESSEGGEGGDVSESGDASYEAPEGDSEKTGTSA